MCEVLTNSGQPVQCEVLTDKGENGHGVQTDGGQTVE